MLARMMTRIALVENLDFEAGGLAGTAQMLASTAQLLPATFGRSSN